MNLLVVLLVVILLCGVGGPFVGAPWPAHYGYGGGGILLVVVILLLFFR